MVGQAEAHRRLIGAVPLELRLDQVRVLQHVRQRHLPQHGDDGPLVLPRQRDRVQVGKSREPTDFQNGRVLWACTKREVLELDRRAGAS
jgi:hypothetical protein